MGGAPTLRVAAFLLILLEGGEDRTTFGTTGCASGGQADQRPARPATGSGRLGEQATALIKTQRLYAYPATRAKPPIVSLFIA